jgi:hypothetical protein
VRLRSSLASCRIDLHAGQTKKQCKVLTFGFFFFVLFLLVLNITSNPIIVQTNDIDKISSRPKMIAPIRFLFQLRVTLEQLDRKFSFQSSHKFRNRYARWNGHQKVNMIRLNVQLFNIAAVPLSELPNIMLHQILDDARQDAKAVFRIPNYVVITLPNYMTCCLYLLIAHSYHF